MILWQILKGLGWLVWNSILGIFYFFRAVWAIGVKLSAKSGVEP